MGKVSDVKSVQDKIQLAAIRYGVPIEVAMSVAKRESNYQQSAISPKGAIGIFQLMPNTAKGLGVNPYVEDENIEGGINYLSYLYKRYGDWGKAIAAYNAGPTRIDKNYYPSETRRYVDNVLRDIGNFSDWFSGNTLIGSSSSGRSDGGSSTGDSIEWFKDIPEDDRDIAASLLVIGMLAVLGIAVAR